MTPSQKWVVGMKQPLVARQFPERAPRNVAPTPYSIRNMR